MVNASKQDRFEALCARTWDNRLRAANDDGAPSPVLARAHSAPEVGDADGDENNWHANASGTGQMFGGTGTNVRSGTSKSAVFATRVPEDIAEEMRVVEADIAAVR